VTAPQAAADIVHGVMKKLVELSVEGAKVLDLCVKGDELLEEGTGAVYNKAVKGVKVPKGACARRPDCVRSRRASPGQASRSRRASPSTTPSRTFRRSRACPRRPSRPPRARADARRRSDPQSEIVLAAGDVVKLHLGAHIDGFAAVSAETLVVGASAEAPATGRKADAVRAAWTAAEAAMRAIKVGAKNWAVTDAVGKAAAAWDCKPVEGASSRARRSSTHADRAAQACSRASRRRT
jgi:methionine aminopeptidase